MSHSIFHLDPLPGSVYVLPSVPRQLPPVWSGVGAAVELGSEAGVTVTVVGGASDFGVSVADGCSVRTEVTVTFSTDLVLSSAGELEEEEEEEEEDDDDDDVDFTPKLESESEMPDCEEDTDALVMIGWLVVAIWSLAKVRDTVSVAIWGDGVGVVLGWFPISVVEDSGSAALEAFFRVTPTAAPTAAPTSNARTKHTMTSQNILLRSPHMVGGGRGRLGVTTAF